MGEATVIGMTVGVAVAPIPVGAGSGTSACAELIDYTVLSAGGFDTVTFRSTASSCLYTIPAGVSSIDYLVVGGGGGRGNGNGVPNQSNAGDGGAGGDGTVGIRFATPGTEVPSIDFKFDLDPAWYQRHQLPDTH